MSASFEMICLYLGLKSKYMKKLLFSLPLIFLAFAANCQIVLQGNDTVFTNGPATEFEIVAYANVVNNSGAAVSLRWIKLQTNMPNGWSSTVCDVNACYPDNTDSADFVLAARATGNIDGHFYPNGVVGNGVLRVRVFEVSNPSNQAIITFIGSTNAASVGNLSKPSLKLYPVPATDFIHVELSILDEEGQIEIFNMIGKKMAVYPLCGNKSKIPIAFLPKGQYIMRIESSKGLVTKSFVKQ